MSAQTRIGRAISIGSLNDRASHFDWMRPMIGRAILIGFPL